MNLYRYIFLSIIACPAFLTGVGQVSFRTVIPQRPIVVNESFQVQYIVENASEISNFSPPSFTGFRIVTGPNIYTDNQLKSRKNLVLTLAAINEGKFKIPGATCTINGKMLKSNDVVIKVVPQGETDGSYFLAAGEDPYKKIKQNLFLKLTVDKQSCLIGEPLVATFKLYSRLQSKSNVIKNPGFYGFSVYDMVEVNDQVQGEEKINGHWFDVHTIRKVQLYPFEAGIFTIDPMELSNQVEFSRTPIHKKTEQVVTENMYNKDADSEHKTNSALYEMNIKSAPVVVNVKPLPSKNSPDTFAGAVGNFSINASVAKDSLLKNEEDSMILEISGAGNFQRVNAPVVSWPENFETFEPSVKDSFDKTQVPLAGKRRFKYIFVSNQPGFHTIPSASFTFFDLKTKSYKKVSTKPFTIFISAKAKNTKAALALLTPGRANWDSRWILIASGAFVLGTGITLWLLNKRKRKNQIEREEATRPVQSVHQVLIPAKSVIENDDKTFYETLDRCIWNYFKDRLTVSGTPMIKSELSNILLSKKVNYDVVSKLLRIIHQCETSIYSSVSMNFNRPEILETTQQVLAAIDACLKQQNA